MNINKTIGYFMLFVGLFIISLTLYYSYNIFTGDRKFSSAIDFDSFFEKTESQINEIIPSEKISSFFDLTAWFMLSIILILGGSKISYIGIKLIHEK